jgi:DNA-binding beta-propeller fold protein YncE
MTIRMKQATIASAGLVLAACSGGSPDPSGQGAAHSSSASTEAIHLPFGPLSQPVVPRLAQSPMASGSTVPDNGDLNPYGVAFVPPRFPASKLLHPGDVIVSNFNNLVPPSGQQGLGTTIVKINLNASPTLFYSNPDPKFAGFSTALGALSEGLVLVGNLPSTDPVNPGQCTQAGDVEGGVGQGALQVIDRNGNMVGSLEDAKFLDGPWDLTVDDDGDHALVFVSNALSGSVTRLNLRVHPDGVDVESMTIIASGYAHECNGGAFVVAPTGLALDASRDVLYVASTDDNMIFAIDHASTRRTDEGMGRVVVDDQTHLHGPLGLVLAPNGDLISAQGDAINVTLDVNEIVEFSPRGQFIAQMPVEPPPGGAAFGIALTTVGPFIRFAAVDDAVNALDEWLVLPR